MSLNSRHVAGWIMTLPGPVYGEDEEEIFLRAYAAFLKARRLKQEDFDIEEFKQHLAAQGYKPSTRKNHGNGQTYHILQLPTKSSAF